MWGHTHVYQPLTQFDAFVWNENFQMLNNNFTPYQIKRTLAVKTPLTALKWINHNTQLRAVFSWPLYRALLLSWHFPVLIDSSVL